MNYEEDVYTQKMHPVTLEVMRLSIREKMTPADAAIKLIKERDIQVLDQQSQIMELQAKLISIKSSILLAEAWTKDQVMSQQEIMLGTVKDIQRVVYETE